MRCAKYNKATGTCAAPIRNQYVAFLQEAFSFYNGGTLCQSPMTNPISASYGNGAGCPDWAPCPDQMGTYTPGEQFTIMWYARNHAVDNQSPGSVFLYMSPKEASNQGQDVSQAAMSANLICQGPFMNCGGVNQDMTPCTLDCTMPTNTQAGIYTLWWKWDWQNGAMYSTCADIVVTGSSSPNPPVIIPVTSGVVAPATPATTKAATPVVNPVPATTGRAPVATTGKLPAATTRAAVVAPATTGRAPVATTGKPPAATTGSVVQGSPCLLGHQQCTSTNTYQTCGWATSTVTGWGRNQTCPTGLSCHAVQSNFVWCYA